LNKKLVLSYECWVMGGDKIMEKIKTFRDLRIWQEGIKLVKGIYQLTKKFPKDEKYGLTTQMRRASVSVPSNVAEGFRRNYKKEFKQFLNIALSSLAELETQIVISKELNYINVSQEEPFLKDIDYISRMITTLKGKLN